MSKLTIGTTEHGNIFSWPAGLNGVTQTFAILAQKGKGKSYTASVTAEEMLKAGQQIVVLDPTGAWFGLQSSADGRSEGFPVVVFGGDHANVPLEQGAGEIIAQAIVEKGFSAIIDLSLFRKNETSRFVTLFLETLYRLNRKPVHLFIDEADDLCPQKPYGDEAKMVGAVEDVVKRGRKKGIGCTLITQRPADLAKQVLTQCEVLITLGLNHPRDIDAIKEWIAVHANPQTAKEMIASLPSLPRGKAWIWSPGWGDLFELVSIRRRETFDSGATPKPGETIAQPKKLAPIDIEALGKTIAETVERKKADDPKELRAKIVKLERELAAKPVAAKAVTETKTVEVPVLKDGQLKRAESILEKLVALRDSLSEPIKELSAACAKVNAPAPRSLVYVQAKSVHANPQNVPSKPRIVHEATKNVPSADATLSNPERRIVNAIAWMEALGIGQPQKTAVAFLADYTYGSGGFNNPCGSLRTKGLIDWSRRYRQCRQFDAPG